MSPAVVSSKTDMVLGGFDGVDGEVCTIVSFSTIAIWRLALLEQMTKVALNMDDLKPNLSRVAQLGHVISDQDDERTQRKDTARANGRILGTGIIHEVFDTDYG